MNTEMFEPSINWSRELLSSAVWVAITFVATAICLLVILVLIGRFTEWGRQFWRVTGDYFKGRQSLTVWLLFGFLLFSVIVSVRINVLLTYYVNDLFTAVQVAFQGSSTGIAGFWAAMAVFAVLAGCYTVRLLLDMYVTQRFIMRWRIWLSHRFIGEWLGDLAYFRAQFSGRPIDNPDQRIQQDIDVFTTGVGGDTNNPIYNSGNTLLFGAVEAVLSVVSFGPILWRLSGSLTLGGFTLERALFWIVLIYVLIATIIAFVIGRPLIRLSYLNELRNAGFRYALVRVRDASAAIGLYQGEPAEQTLLNGRLDSVMENYRGWLKRMMLFFGWNVSIGQAINPLPWLVQANALFAQRTISLGDVFQSSNAFGAIHDSLSFFRNAYDQFASYRAAIIRLEGLVDQNARAGNFTAVQTEQSRGTSLEVVGVEVRRPDGTPLVHTLDVTLEPGESLLIAGPSGIGKSVLLQSLAGLWPFASGRVRLPKGRDEAMFVPQLPYLPIGDLRTVVTYPLQPGAVEDRVVQQALLDVALSHLVIRLNDVQEWTKVLSVGEQQRIAFARILLSRPSAVFLDETTSSMDEGLEQMLYLGLRAALPDTIVVSVSHRATVRQFHGRRLELVGDGEWTLDRLTPSG